MSKGKKKKNKTVYIDDGRTIADMSGVGGRKYSSSDPSFGKNASFKDKARTFFTAMKMNVAPMLVMMGAITAVFLIIYIILEIAS